MTVELDNLATLKRRVSGRKIGQGFKLPNGKIQTSVGIEEPTRRTVERLALRLGVSLSEACEFLIEYALDEIDE